MDTRALAVMLLVGLVTGTLAGIVLPFAKWGFAGTVLVGVLGGVVGGWLLGVANVRPRLGHPLLDSVATATIGALVVLVLARLVA